MSMSTEGWFLRCDKGDLLAVHDHRQWIEHLCQGGHFEEATAILSRAAAEMPDRAYLRQAQGEVRQRWAKAISAAPQSGLPLPLPCVANAVKVD